ncbi:hypothetical protein EDB86DRAFT_3073457 [Lactarius hatsudake]|nr:hypothetical protein EDB86DRAFT_3073457 [Lactarius hatsudake]
MDTIFRVLFLHMRTFWRRARGLFVSIWFQRLHISGSQKNAPATRIHRPPTPIPPSPSGAASRIPPKISMARTKVWACLRARKLKAQMRERRKAKKQAMYARIAARVTAVAVGKGKEGTKGEDEEEDEEEEVREEDGHFDVPLPSSAPLRGYLSLAVAITTPSLGPTDSCTSSSGSTTTAPRTPRMYGHRIPKEACYACVRTTSAGTHAPADDSARSPASITARSPLSLSFPISFSLPLAARRASSPNVTLQRYTMGGAADGEDREGEDPFGTHGSGYYAPGEWAALGHGDAYDLSADRGIRVCLSCSSARGVRAAVDVRAAHGRAVGALTWARERKRRRRWGEDIEGRADAHAREHEHT